MARSRGRMRKRKDEMEAIVGAYFGPTKGLILCSISLLYFRK